MKTVKVRIAVVVDKDGDWNASGWGGYNKNPSKSDIMDSAVEFVADGEARYWIETELEVPEEKVIKCNAVKEV